MNLLSPWNAMLLTPGCPPAWARLATLLAIATLEVVLLLIGPPVEQSLLVLAVVCGLAMLVMGRVAVTASGKLGAAFKVLTGLAGAATAGAVTG
ncbi:hypothetical protein [Actinokineospora sp. NPDC004072]